MLIYAAHLLFWGAFVATRWGTRGQADGAAPTAGSAPSPAASAPRTARFSRLVLFAHALAFGVMYYGIGAAVLPTTPRRPEGPAGYPAVGAAIILLGAVLCCWALASFASWRFRARLDAGHRLATGGPFAVVRNPIYLGLDLLALGTAAWLPTPATGVALALIILGGDLRARREETVLSEAFGEEYRAYRARTRRFLPGVY